MGKTMAEYMLEQLDAPANLSEQAEQETRPNLIVYLSGLGVTHDTGGSWQTVFLDGIPNHPLRVEVYKRENGYRTNIFRTEADGLDPDRSLSLNIPGISDFPTQTNNDADDKNIQYILDFASSDLHAPSVKIAKPVGMSLTKFEVSGGLAFTAYYAPADEHGNDKYCLVKHNDTSCTKQFRLGTWMGVQYTVNQGNVASLEVKSLLMDGTIKLPFKNGSVYEICVYNHCERNLNEIDFPYYYTKGHGTPPNRKQGIIAVDHPIELRYLGEPLKSIVGGRVDCNLMRVSKIDGGKTLFEALA